MSPTHFDWHQRFLQQAAWTEPIRQHLLGRLGSRARILEVGSGTGAITATLHAYANTGVFGVDLNRASLHIAKQNDPRTRLTAGDALRLPFPQGVFDTVVCHFLLLWIPDAQQALVEMTRVSRPGAAVIAFAEPDYGARIDYPPQLERLGRLQSAALRRQGAQPEMGRRLSGLFHRSGLQDIETGLLGGQWKGAPAPEQMASEWDTLQADLAGEISAGELAALRRIDEQAWRSGERVLFVPTFYAIGWKPITA